MNVFIVWEQQEECECSVWEVDRVSVHGGAGGLRRTQEEESQQNGTPPNPLLQGC